MKQSTPFFSIIIPTCNRAKQLSLCLESLSHLDYPKARFEVIVVDDGSTSPLESVVAPLREKLNIDLYRQANAGPGTARNTGAKHAKGDFLAFTDDDCQPHPEWLRALATHCVKHPQHLVGGYTVNDLPKNLYSKASQQLISFLYQYYNGQKGRGGFFASNNMVIPAQQFRDIGGFDTSFPLAAGEDRELCDRWLFHGYPMSYVPEAQVQHAHAMAMRSFWRQHFNYGRGAFYYHQKRSQRSQSHMKKEPMSFYRDLLLYPRSQSRDLPSLLLVGLMLVTQVANTLGYFFEVSRQRVLANT